MKDFQVLRDTFHQIRIILLGVWRATFLLGPSYPMVISILYYSISYPSETKVLINPKLLGRPHNLLLIKFQLLFSLYSSCKGRYLAAFNVPSI